MSSFNGLVLVDKPAGLTSHDVVNRARKLFNIRAVGHAGTLDPMATGLLVLMVGEATKLSDYILSGNKLYRAEILLGVETDTWDITGSVVSRIQDEREGLPAPLPLDEQCVRDTVAELRGCLSLPVPQYSAVKVDGKKLYERARKQEEVPGLEREMNFFLVEFLSYKENRVEVLLGCEKGGYVRSWAVQLGQRLGCGGTLFALRRERSEPYAIADAATLQELEACKAAGVELGYHNWWDRASACIPIRQALPNIPSLSVSHRDEKLMRNGAISDALRVQLRVSPRFSGAEYVKVVAQDSQQLISILAARRPAGFAIRRVFNSLS